MGRNLPQSGQLMVVWCNPLFPYMRCPRCSGQQTLEYGPRKTRPQCWMEQLAAFPSLQMTPCHIPKGFVETELAIDVMMWTILCERYSRWRVQERGAQWAKED